MNARPRPLDPPMLRLDLGRDIHRVRAAVERVQKFLKNHGCEDGARADCELAVVEGCNNAIKHAYPDSVPGQVILEVVLLPGQIEIHIIDHGPGFVWPERIMLPDPQNESGRGLYLIRVLMDCVDYVRGPAENVLVLRKRLDNRRGNRGQLY
jgi:anti-sigma regulatory factor (Ser/Thr protein kinase)